MVHKNNQTRNKKETTLELELKTAKLFLHTSSTTWYIDLGSKPISATRRGHKYSNTTLITSESKCDDVRNTEVSQAGSSITCLITDLTLPVNALDMDTSIANVDSNDFTIHTGAQIIAENESLKDHGDGSKINCL